MNTPRRPPPFRAEHIGSLLRPPELLRAREEFQSGRTDRDALAAAEDDAIRTVVKQQENAGLQVVTDGEFRRNIYSDSFTTDGISGLKIESTENEGWKSSDTHGVRTARRIPKVVSRIEWIGSRNAADFRFLKTCTTRTPKITLPGPAFIHYRAGRPNISREVYPDLDTFWADLVTAYHREIVVLHEAGCRYVQIDETSLVKLGDPRARQLLADRGDDWRDLLRTYIRVVNEVVSGAPADMTIGVHVCRSQDASWQANVGYDPIAPALFNDMKVNTYFLEYDNARAGGFEPLAQVPNGKTVVLGLVSSRTPDVETADFLKRRIDEAARHIPLVQLGLSPQCGFATSAHKDYGAGMTRNLQMAKLARVVEVANEVWGSP